MNDELSRPNDGDNEDLEAIYGSPLPSLTSQPEKRVDFQPWHHPVKQVVREFQWKELTRRLLSERSDKPDVLQYFTLPGPDLLDVTVLAQACQSLGVAIRYFGFDAATDSSSASSGSELTRYLVAESALRQSNLITSDAVVFTVASKTSHERIRTQPNSLECSRRLT